MAVKAPDIWFKTQRVIRTILIVAPTFLVGANASLPMLAEAFNAPGVPAHVYLWVNGAIGVLLVVTGVLTRIIAIPAVNDFLTRLGAGSVPKGYVESN